MRSMKYLGSLFFTGILALCLLAGAMSGAKAQTAALKDLQWEKRVLLLFAKSRSDASLDRQVDLLRERRPDLEERKLVVLVTAGDRDTASAIGYAFLPAGASRNLRRTFEPAERGLTAILVGLDGGEKARWQRLVAPDEIFDLIDSMPMRQSEMEKSG